MIIPRGAENTGNLYKKMKLKWNVFSVVGLVIVAIKLIGEHIRDILSREPGISRSTNHRIVLTSSLSEPMGYQTGYAITNFVVEEYN